MQTRTIDGVTLSLIQGDITGVSADAIVNAANAALAGGGGVDGAIHRAGGSAIMQECRKIGGCPPGGAVATTAGKLPARYIFHAVGPIYGHDDDAERLLAGAYQSCLDLAEQHKIESIAFPALSTGVYRYPLGPAARVALRTIIGHIQHPGQGGATSLKRVMLVLYGEQAYRAFESALDEALLLP